MFCFTCVVASMNKLLHSVSSLEQTFISTGFCNWKDATTKVAKHEASQCHKEAVLKSVTLPSSMRNIGKMFSFQLTKQRLMR